VINVPSLQDLKSVKNFLQKMRTNRLKIYIKILRDCVRKKDASGEIRASALRNCSKCGEEKPLNVDMFQKVKFFKEGFSFYCNSCDKPVKKEE
jgi:hypothetical protein